MKGICDIHCHILPGVDDGASSMEEAMELLRLEQREGVESIILTPHFRKGMFEASDETIRRTFLRLQEMASDGGIAVKLYLGCEYHVNMEIEEDLRKGRRPTLAGSYYALCEFPGGADASFVRERCYRLLSCAYTPVLAHIERYNIFRKNLDLVDELSEVGCKMQINADSIIGREGFGTRRFCKKLLQYGLVDFVGSDGHNLSDRLPRMGACAEYLQKKLGEAGARKILCENPRQITEAQGF